MTFRRGDRLCNCTLLQKCGSGAYGEVWLAEDAIGTRVALKIISNRGRYSKRELAGLRNYKECNHPNLLKIRYVEITDDRICYTMDVADDLNHGQGEYLPDTLGNRLQRYGRLDGKEIIAMLDGLLAGLEELHRQKLVHRDIKPDNILWVNGRPTLADAGLIAQDGQGSLVGTPGFLSPKLLEGRGAADAGDDFYALGKVIYCALTGLPVREYPALPEDLTISLNADLNRALRESCSHPVRSTAEFRRLLRGPQEQALETEKGPHPGRKPSRSALRFLREVAVWGGGLLLLAGFWFWNSRLRERIRAVEQRPLPEPVPSMSESERKAHLKSMEEELARSQAEFQEKTRRWQQTLQKQLQAAQQSQVVPEKVPVAQSQQGQVPEVKSSAGPARESEFQREMRAQAVEMFRDLCVFEDNGELLLELLAYKPLTAREAIALLTGSSSNPRLVPMAGAPPRRAKKASPLELELVRSFQSLYPDFDQATVKRRQQYWRQAAGSEEEKLEAMLTSDPIMQAVALDALIRSGINIILQKGTPAVAYRNLLLPLFYVRYGLLEPGAAKDFFRLDWKNMK